MRISTNSIFNPYERALSKTQSEKMQEQLRLTTGKDIIELADDPKRLVTAKSLTNLIDRNSTFKDSIELGLNEMVVVEEQMREISDKLQTIRENAIDSTLTGNSGNYAPIGTYIKGLLTDLVKDANLDFNGHYVYSGTQTTADSMNNIGSAESPYPFELIEGEATADNPSGLSVVFKGNNKDRLINKDAIHTEVINTKASDIFGGNGTKIFDTIIKLYNLMSYNEDGSNRRTEDLLNREQIAQIDDYQKELADTVIQVNTASAVLGAKYKTLDNLRLQMTNEEFILKDFRSIAEDTDVARSTLNLKKAENALSYSLQVGGTILNQSLFDYIR